MFTLPEKSTPNKERGFTPLLKRIVFHIPLFTNESNSRLSSSRAGFTLIEAMVSLVILTAAMGPLLYLATTAVNSAFIIRDNMIASGLAQEGAEVVRSIRDANWFNNLPFDSGLANGTYRVEWDSESLIALGSNPTLRIDDGLYNYSTGTNTLFTRTITITKINDGELRIVSEVSWPVRGGNTKNIQVESHLYNWK